MTPTDRRALAALGLIGALALALLTWGLGAGAPADAPAPERLPRVAPTARSGARVSLPRPTAPRPDAPRSPPAAPLDGARKYALNEAVDAVVREGRAACLAGGAAGSDDAERELVLDVVAIEGEVTDFGVRAPGGEGLPPDVVQCLGDVVWARDWPRFEGLPGETRLQRVFTVAPEPR